VSALTPPTANSVAPAIRPGLGEGRGATTRGPAGHCRWVRVDGAPLRAATPARGRPQPGDKLDLRACDHAASHLKGLDGAPAFRVYWPLAARDAAKQRMLALLRAK
jgi:hypothetical protein